MDKPRLVQELPSALISYSWDWPSHKEWVTACGVSLRDDGIHAHWDEWDTQLGDQLALAHEKSLLSSTPVGEAAREIAAQVPRRRKTRISRPEGRRLTGFKWTADSAR